MQYIFYNTLNQNQRLIISGQESPGVTTRATICDGKELRDYINGRIIDCDIHYKDDMVIGAPNTPFPEIQIQVGHANEIFLAAWNTQVTNADTIAPGRTHRMYTLKSFNLYEHTNSVNIYCNNRAGFGTIVSQIRISFRYIPESLLQL
jgi:hypothetical protein